MSGVPHDPYAPQDPQVVEAHEAKSAASSEQSPVGADPVVVEPVPKGTSAEVMDWVGGDEDRAQQAYDAELATSKPRKGLLDELEEILGA